MKILVIGIGKVGTTLTRSLVKEGHEVIVLDVSEEKVNALVNTIDANGVVGSGLSKDSLLEAGVDTADVVISCATNDETNILCCTIAKKLGAKQTIARVRDPQYFYEVRNIKSELGLDLVFNPELRCAHDTTEIIKFPSAKSVDSFAKGKATMVEFDILEGNPIIGKTVMEISKEYGKSVLFASIKRDEKVIVPRGDTEVLEGDSVYIIATESALASFCRKIKIFKPRPKSLLIIGGGKTAYYVAKRLEGLGISIKIVEKDKARCEFLSAELPSVEVVLGDGTRQSFLDEMGLRTFDACITLTGQDEENVIISLYAKMQKVDKVITKVNRQSVADMVKVFGLESIVSPRESIANYIIRFIRGISIDNESGIKNFYKVNEKVEAVEVMVGDDFEKLNVSLKDLKIRKDALIGGIVRNDEFVLPTGDTTLSVGDKVIIVSTIKGITELGDILK